MPANTYAELLDFPGNFATAWGAILSADLATLIGTDTHATNTAFLFGPRDNSGFMPEDRIEYSSTGWRRASNQQVQNSAGLWFDAHYAGQLYSSVVTPRSVNVALAMHSTRVGRLLALSQATAARFTTNNLPYYEIAYLGLATASRSEPNQEEDVDRTDLVWDVELWIKPTAIPTAAP